MILSERAINERQTELKSELHSPSELLRTAEELFASGNPNYTRPAVLEAVTCLEVYIRQVIFPALELKLDPLLVVWLEDKTKMDFDSRLSVFTPIALGHPIDKASSLWKDYKKAREIRNKVTHSGERVSQSEARFVLNTVHDLLAYLVSSVEIELTLRNLKYEIETRKIILSDEAEVVDLVQNFFGEVHNATAIGHERLEIFGQATSPDVVLLFGKYKIAVNAKFNPRHWIDLILAEEKLTQDHNRSTSGHYFLPNSFTHGVNILFNPGKVIPDNQSFEKTQDDRIITIIINSGKETC